MLQLKFKQRQQHQQGQLKMPNYHPSTPQNRKIQLFYYTNHFTNFIATRGCKRRAGQVTWREAHRPSKQNAPRAHTQLNLQNK